MRRVWVSSAAYEAALQTVIDARRAAGLSQRELADRLSKHRSFVSKVEARGRRLDIVEFIVWAKALGLTPAELIGAVEASLPENIEI